MPFPTGNGFFFFLCLVVLNAGKLMGQEKTIDGTAFRLLLSGLLSHDVPELSVDSAKHKLENSELTFLDARGRQEFEVSHIQGAHWVGYEDFSLNRVKEIPKDKPIVVYCSIGKRSEDITKKLRDAGYKDVSNLYGGIFEWVNRAYPVVKNEQPTDSIHGYSKMWSVWLKRGKIVY